MSFRDRVTELRRVRAGDLAANPRNWRTHGDDQRRALDAMLQEVGFAGAVIARETPSGLELIDGHLRAEMDPEAVVPVLVVDLDENEAAKLLATHDPIGAMAGADTDTLRELLVSIETSSPDVSDLLKRVEFDARAVPANKPAKKADPDAIDPTEALQKKWGTERGQLWSVGRHRIMCGDSFEADDMSALMGGEEAEVDAVLTDPPYAIYGSSSGISSSIADDKMVRPFFASLFRLIRERVKVFGHAYVHCDWRSWAAVWEGARAGGMAPKNCLVWDKGSFGLGANYPNAHEFVGYFSHLPPQKAMTSGNATGQRQVLTTANILRFPRVSGEDRQHNAAKPIAMLELLIENSTDEFERVLDPFLGSGSTLIAAQNKGRIGFGMELEPNWVAVCLERLASMGLAVEQVT